MTLITTGDGNTPLAPEEQDDLIPDLTTKEELNEWERQNIVEAAEWAVDPRNLNRQDPFSEADHDTYLDNPVLVTMKVLEAAGMLSTP